MSEIRAILDTQMQDMRSMFEDKFKEISSVKGGATAHKIPFHSAALSL